MPARYKRENILIMEVKENKKIDPRNLKTVKQYSEMMGVTIQTVYRWLNDGKIKTVDFLGKAFIDKSTYKG